MVGTIYTYMRPRFNNPRVKLFCNSSHTPMAEAVGIKGQASAKAFNRGYESWTGKDKLVAR